MFERRHVPAGVESIHIRRCKRYLNFVPRDACLGFRVNDRLCVVDNGALSNFSELRSQPVNGDSSIVVQKKRKKNMKNIKLVLITLISVLLLALPAWAGWRVANVYVSPGYVSSDVTNYTGYTVRCTGKVYGVFANGAHLWSYFDSYVPPGATAYAYVYTQRHPFVDGYANIYCGR